MGLKKHKKHKSEKRERSEDILTSDRPPGLKIILKVGGNISTPEHSNDSLPPMSFGNVQTEDESLSLASLTSGSYSERHKKLKKKKKKKEREKSKERHEKKHKHRHKEKKKRTHDESTLDEMSLGEESSIESMKKPHLELSTIPPVVVSNPKTATEQPPSKPSSPRAPMSPRSEAREQRACVVRQKLEHTPFSKLLEYLLKLLEKKDPQQFFAWPVTDSFAPGYSNIITQPMDFSTIKQKIDDHIYNTLNDFMNDFKLMCNNAMTYNHQDTIYYKAARKLLHHGLKILSPEKIRPLSSVLPFMSEVTSEQVGFELGPPDTSDHETIEEEIDNEETDEKIKSKEPKEMPKTKFEAIPDDMSPTQILKQVQGAAKEASKKLAKKKTGCMGFLRQKKDNTTTLNILIPSDGVIPGTNERPVLLGSLIGKLQHGTGQIQGFKEDRRNYVKAVKPLYYGAFGSYAPSYDSTFANLTKEESDLVFQTYGDETSVQYAESILDFAKDCDYALTMVDNLLDLMTGGDHRRTKRVLEERRRLKEEEERIRQLMEPSPSRTSNVSVDFQSLRSLSELGIDTSFLDAFDKDASKKQDQPVGDEALQSRLDDTSILIQKLNKVQNERLSQPPPAHLAHILGPSEIEIDLAERVTDNLSEMSKRLPPEAVAPVSSIRKALGVAAIVQEPPVPDLESELREFLESQSALSVDQSPLHDDKTIEEILSES
ncbi:hypothetical protein RUM44_011368 [Polyplax serrata]|uniref:Bromo domain-containing protein n=1 Tax=Polyplax serrata TaxID=468196 RepID=A0ABR1AQ34_POLSC